MVEVVDAATNVRKKVASDDDAVCLMEVLQFELSKHCEWTADDRYFLHHDGTPFDNSYEVICDYEGRTELYIRESVFRALFRDFRDGVTLADFHNAKQALAHDAGHVILSSHRRKIRARLRYRNDNSSKRAAHNRKRIEGEKLSPASFHKDIENEADIFGTALQVPLEKLGAEPSINEISEKYDTSYRCALDAALLSRDYYNAKFIQSCQ